jgi:hypothetical protein
VSCVWKGRKVIEVTIKIPSLLGKLNVKIFLLYRRLRFGYAFRTIPLTRGKFAIVDPEDYSRLARFKWHTHTGTSTFYAVRHKPGSCKKLIWMHREILGIPPHLYVDHINHNGLDNRKANLRPATKSQNCRNKLLGRKNTSSKYRGVHWHSRFGKWQAAIKVNRRPIHLGYFKDEIDAAKAYDTAALKYHGEFAVINFPRPPGSKGRSLSAVACSLWRRRNKASLKYRSAAKIRRSKMAKEDHGDFGKINFKG